MNGEVLPRLTRRMLIGSGAVAAAALAGCGASDNQTGSSAGAPVTGPRKRGGTFRFAPADASSGDTLDPQSAAGVSWPIASAMFNTLIDLDHQLVPHLGLAEELGPEGNDQASWVIRVRDGVEFHNGKTLDIDDVIFSIKRILNPKAPGFTAGLMAAIDPNRMKKLDKRTVRLTLKFPNSQLGQPFAQIPTAIVPVGFDVKQPVGTGPFKYVSFVPGQRFVADRFEHYWRNGKPYLDRLELLTFANADTARVNALLSGQLDGMDRVTATQVPRLKARGNITVVESKSGAFEPIAMRCGKGDQFEDPRVRMAFKLLPDRQQLVNAIYGGKGGLGNDLGVWSAWDPDVDPSLPQREQDLEQARSLLKAAGKDGMSVSFRVGEVAPGQLDTAGILVQNAKKIGVNVKLDVVPVSQFYSGKSYFTSQMKNDYLYTTTMYRNMTYCWLPQAGYNNTGYANPQTVKLFNQALSSPAAKSQELMREVSRIVHDDGPWLVWGRRDVSDAYTSKFTGAVPDAHGISLNGLRWDEISLS